MRSANLTPAVMNSRARVTNSRRCSAIPLRNCHTLSDSDSVDLVYYSTVVCCDSSSMAVGATQ
jgi:hypothetical protein